MTAASQALTVTYSCGHQLHRAIGDPLYDRCFTCYPPANINALGKLHREQQLRDDKANA